MFTKFKKKYKSIFLDPDSDPDSEVLHVRGLTGQANEKINIILSPTLYWVKKLYLPLKNVRDVKKLLPSLFEDTLPSGNYSYSAYKSGSEFYIFAYEDKKILDLLLQKGISLSNVAALFFAQSEFGTCESAIRINEFQCIYVKDEIVIVIPSSWIQDSKTLDLTYIKPLKHSITLKQFGHVVDSKSLYKIGVIMTLLISLIATEYFITAKKTADMLKLKEELFTKYNLQSTMLQNSATLKKYDSMYITQMKIREYISYLLALKLNDKEELVSISLKNNILQAEFSGITEGKELPITQILRDNKVNFKSFFKDKFWHVELSI
ncbi:MAG: hypothetical protein NTW78_04980 [Campylobacterales bacterium]|nr:hypothetical protein [Campylobacterales bacterium]